METDNQVIIGGAKIMENPGLKSHGSPEPFLKVSNRRYASPPPMATPYTNTTEQGMLYNDLFDPLMPNNQDHTEREDVEKAPPQAGGASPSPVGVENGGEGADPWIEEHQSTKYHQAGAAVTQVPGEVRTKRSPGDMNTTHSTQPLQSAPALKAMDHTLEDQQAALTQGAKQRRIDTQKGVGGGVKENPAHDRAQEEQVRPKQISRPTHPVGKHPGARVNPGVTAHHNPTEDMHDLMDVQGADGNWNYDQYMHGMFNGMELMRAIHDRDEPAFREAPKKWLYESAAHPPIAVKDYEGREGNNEHITRNEQGMIPVSWVANMKGARGEMPGQHRNAEGPEWEQFKQHVAAGTPGYSSPVFVVVEHGKEPLLYEGNHRRDAHVELGSTHIPAEIRYFGHAERQGTVGERAMRRQATQNEEQDSYGENEITPEERDQLESDPRGSLEHMINGLPEATSGPRLPYTRVTHDQHSQLAGLGFEKHTDPEDWDANYPWWTKDGVTISPSRDEPRGGYWETQHGEADPVFHLDFQSALNHATRRPEPRKPNSIGPFTPSARPDVKVQTWSSVLHVADEEDDWWARQPDVTSDMGVSPDAHQEAFMDTGDVEHDLEDAIPRNTALREHAHVLRNGFRWDGDERYPKYEQEHWRNIIDADGRPAGDKEGQVIERNTHVLRPVLEEGVNPLAHPWMHTYYPAGQGDDRGLVGGHNTAEQAVRAAHQLSLWGARHPDSQELLKNYQYVGDQGPYDPTEMLPHENAQRMGHV